MEEFWLEPIGLLLDLWACRKQWHGIEKPKRMLKYSRNRLYKIQSQHKLFSIRKHKFKAITKPRHSYPVADNLLNQNFKTAEPNRIWVTDISYIGTDEGWLYLDTVKDFFDCKIVGFSTWNAETQGRVKKYSGLGRYV